MNDYLPTNNDRRQYEKWQSLKTTQRCLRSVVSYILFNNAQAVLNVIRMAIPGMVMIILLCSVVVGKPFQERRAREP